MAKLDFGDKIAAATLAAAKTRNSGYKSEDNIFESYEAFLKLFQERADAIEAGGEQSASGTWDKLAGTL